MSLWIYRALFQCSTKDWSVNKSALIPVTMGNDGMPCRRTRLRTIARITDELHWYCLIGSRIYPQKSIMTFMAFSSAACLNTS